MKRVLSVLLLTLVLITLALPGAAEVLYKRYYVHNVNGKDILSEPYSVQPNDYVIKILKARGEISHENFPLFLNIFKLINHQIADINRIHTGDRIFIPLRWLEPDSLPGQRKGVVDLPFITAAPVKRLLAENTTTRTVKRGDSVSRIVAQSFGPVGSRNYQNGMKLFKLVNPELKDLHRIYVGQKLTIPKSEVLKASWAESVLKSGEVILGNAQEQPPEEETSEEPSTDAPAAVVYDASKELGKKDPFKALPKLLGGVLLNRGRYYFPTPDGDDFSVSLAETPILQLPEGRRILFKGPDSNLTLARQTIMAKHFKNLAFADTSEEPTLILLLESVARTFPQIVVPMPLSSARPGLKLTLTAQWGFRHTSPKKEKRPMTLLVSEVKSPSERFPMELAAFLRNQAIVIREALDDEALPPLFFSNPAKPEMATIVPTTRKVYVEKLAQALGLIYDPHISISFAYAGMQIEATSNMLTAADGTQTLVDYGTIYGDAIFAIESSGLQVLSFTKDDYLYPMTLAILNKLGIPHEENPRFDLGQGANDLSGTLMVEGLLINPAPGIRKLLVAEMLPDEIAAYLHAQGVGIIAIAR